MNFKDIALGFLVGVLAVGSYVLYSQTGTSLGGLTHSSFGTTGNLYASGTLDIAGNANVGSISLDQASTTSEFGCVTGTWNPPAAGSTTVADLDVTMPSTYALGDQLSVGFSTGTLGLALGIRPSGTVANIFLEQPDHDVVASVNVATGTYTACYKAVQ